MSDQININDEFQISGDTLKKYTGQSKYLVISEDIKGIASAAFLDVNTLESVTIPDGVEYLDRRCFENCLHLKTVSIPDSVTRIGEYAFSGCRDLDYVRLPAGLSRIESYTFKDCASLTAVIIPPGVTEIAVDAFIGCSSLESVHIHEGVTSFPAIFNHHPFTGCDKLKIYTPSGSAAERFARENGIPYIIKVIDSPNQAVDTVKPDAPKPKLSRQTIASTKGIFSFSDIEEYLPEDLTDKLLKQAEEEEAAKKARIAAALAPAYSEEPEDAETAYEPDEVYVPDEDLHGSENYQASTTAAVEAKPAERLVEEDPVVRKEAPKPAAPVAVAPKPAETLAAVPKPVTPAAAPKPVTAATAPKPAAPMPTALEPAAPMPAAPAMAAPKPVTAAATVPKPAASIAEVPKPVETVANAPVPAKPTTAPSAAAPEPVKEAEPVSAAVEVTEAPARKEEVVKAEKPAKKTGSIWKRKTPKEKPVKKKPVKEKPVKEKKAPKEKPVKEKKPPKEKPVKEKKEKEPKPKGSKGRTARIVALLVIAAVAIAVIVIAVMNMNVIKPQTGQEPVPKTEEIQKDDYVLTLEDFVNSSDTARSQIDQSIDGTDVKVTVSGNKLIYTYDLSNTEGLSEDDADSDEIRKALEGTLDASNDRFLDLCRSLEKDTGISGISVEVIYSYGDKILLTREYTANGQKN